MNKDKLTDDVFRLMLKNRRQAGRFQYTVPSPDTYPFQWLWDSCFHAIILSLCGSFEDAKKELISLVSHQFDNGMIPHMIYWDKASPTDFPVIEWGKRDTSTITQPPMLSYACLRIYKKDKDSNFLKQIYPNLNRFYRYLLEQRDLRGHHLVGIINPDESGEDNSPRFDPPLGLEPTHSLEVNFGKRLELVGKNLSCNFEIGECMSNFFWVKDVPFNAIMVENLASLAEIASVLGKSEDAQYFLNQKDKISKAMRDWMFEEGIYWSVYDLDYKKIKVKTWAIFAPLFAKLYSKSQAEKVVKEHLLNKAEFNLDFLVPTVSKDELSYHPAGFWRGPVWMATNWFIFKGLLNYGMKEISQKIYQSSLSLIEKSGFREQFDPETGEGLGAREFSWGGLILDMEGGIIYG